MTVAQDTAQVLFCTVNPHPDAAAAVEKYAPQAEIVDVTGDNYAYWNAIRERWTGVRDLIIVEQDIEIGPDTLSSMESCKQDWCCYAYPIFRTKVRLRVGLGCTKISAEAQQKIPVEKIAEGFETCAACRGKGCWWHLDGRVAAMLKKAGFFPHVHGDVTHHHDYDTGMVDGENEGRPVEWFFEEGGDQSPAQVIHPDIVPPFLPAASPRAAIAAANELLRFQEMIAADPQLLRSLNGVHGAMIPFLVHSAPAPKAYDTDKLDQGYMPAYNTIADQLGGDARVCELGVFTGGSLATWKDLFPEGTIAGVDTNPQAFWPEGTIKIIAGQDDPSLPALLAPHAEAWDLIVDDASHDGDLTARAFGLLWPLVSPGGFYVIEDWFVGYPEYQGPCKSPAMLDLAKSLIERLRRDSDTESVSYRYGMAIIRKKALSVSFYADAPAELLYNMPGVGGAVTGTLTSGSSAGAPLLGGGQSWGAGSLIPPCEIPHNYFSKPGKAILVDGVGVYSLGTTIPTMKFALYFDTAIGNVTTLLCATGAFTADTTSRAAMAFNFRAYITATQVGTNGLLQAWGWLNWGMIPTLTTTVTAPQVTYVMGPATTTAISFNTAQTTPVYLEPYASWSTSSTGPSITLTQMFVWGMN
jgi:hypothetical protein